jgi:purine-nucleoside phosphorylase
MAERTAREKAVRAAEHILSQISLRPTTGLVLGSGLSGLAENVLAPAVISFGDIPHFPRATAPGHPGQLVLGRLGGIQVCVMQGRSHYYEGLSSADVAFPIRVMQVLGANTLIVTNAAGGIRPGFRAGDLMAIADHINLVGLAGHNPLRGPNDSGFGPRFPDMSRAYDPELLTALRAEAKSQGIPLHEGVYAMVSGPNFETPAEVRFLRAIGADAVGMSTVPEVVVACHGGMRVLGVSLISNVAIDSTSDTPQEETSHDQVLAVGREALPAMAALIMGVLKRLPPGAAR